MSKSKSSHKIKFTEIQRIITCKKYKTNHDLINIDSQATQAIKEIVQNIHKNIQKLINKRGVGISQYFNVSNQLQKTLGKYQTFENIWKQKQILVNLEEEHEIVPFTGKYNIDIRQIKEAEQIDSIVKFRNDQKSNKKINIALSSKSISKEHSQRNIQKLKSYTKQQTLIEKLKKQHKQIRDSPYISEIERLVQLKQVKERQEELYQSSINEHYVSTDVIRAVKERSLNMSKMNLMRSLTTTKNIEVIKGMTENIRNTVDLQKIPIYYSDDGEISPMTLKYQVKEGNYQKCVDQPKINKHVKVKDRKTHTNPLKPRLQFNANVERVTVFKIQNQRSSGFSELGVNEFLNNNNKGIKMLEDQEKSNYKENHERAIIKLTRNTNTKMMEIKSVKGTMLKLPKI